MFAAGPSGWEIASTVGTLLAAGAAAAAAWASWQAARSYAAIAKRDDDRRTEEQQAALCAHVIGSYKVDKDSHWLQIENLGPADATEVMVEAEPIHHSLDLGLVPDVLPAGAPVVLPYVRIIGVGRPVTTVHWVDGVGPHSSPIHPNPVTLAAGATAMERAAEMRRIARGLRRY